VSGTAWTKPAFAVGDFMVLAGETFAAMFRKPFAWRELIDQIWFVARVSIVPTLVLSIPYTVLIVFTLNIVLIEVGAGDLSGAGAALASVTQVGPVVTAIVVSGAGATAMCADLGARTIREEIDALKVIGINPVQALVVPRVIAATFVALMLYSVVAVVGLAGSYFFVVFVQNVTPGAFAAGLTLLVTRDGVQAVLTLNSDVKVPSDVTAAVHSRSAVGEQFIELTPKPNTNARPLGDGDVVGVGSVQIPADIGSLLDETNTALKAIPQDNLKTVVDEAAKAVGGLGPELSRIVDGSTSLAIEAGKTKDSFTTLIDQFPAVANSQVQTSDSIATWAHHMASITGQLKAQDPAFADLLQKGGPALNEGKALFDRVAPALPVLLANLVSLGQIAVTYRSDIEQLLVLFPQGTAVMSAIALPNADTKQACKGIYLDFNLNLNTPPRAIPDFCRYSSSARRRTRMRPIAPRASCTAGCHRTRR